MPDSRQSAEQIAERIKQGETVSGREIVQCLGIEDVAERVSALLELLKAYLNIGHVERAKALVERAWILSGYASDLLEIYLQIQQHAGDVEAYRQALKRVGLARAEQGEVSAALDLFNRWQYAYVAFHGEDRYEYDPDVLEAVRHMASSKRFAPAFQAPRPDEKLRVAYLMFGTTQANSVIVKISKLFAQYHDKDRVEAAFYVPEPARLVKTQTQAVEALAFIAGQGCNVTVAPDAGSVEEGLVRLAGSIHEFRPHVLVLNAALADFQHYFIAALQPAPVVLGFVSGPPAQFVPPELDGAIAWTWHPLMDSPVPCSHVPLEVDLPDADSFQARARAELGLPEDAVVLAAGGRHLKFRAPAFWQTIAALLERYPNAWFLAVGVTEDQLSHIVPELDAAVRSRLRFAPWMQDYLRVLGTADILLDTFPSGGGVILQDAMAIGMPVVAFENDYLKPFDQTDWSPAQEFMPECELVIPRDNRARYLEVVGRLVTDPAYRASMGALCQRHVFDHFGRPARMVARCEAIYFEWLQRMTQPARGGETGLPGVSLSRVPQLTHTVVTADQRDAAALELDKVDITREESGAYAIQAIYRSKGKKARAEGRIAASDRLSTLRLQDEKTGKPLVITAKDIYRCWAAGYDFQREWDRLLASGKQPSIAFTVVAGSQLGGGTIVLYRFARWLAELGYQVTLYADDAAPGWLELPCRYLTFENAADRYRAITEDVVIVYSMLELLHVLKAQPKGKAILHLCQGLEHLHYPAQASDQVFRDIFDIFYALPVGRIVVSPHLYDFFAEHYAQRSFFIPNGIDHRVFQYQAGRPRADSGRKQVLVVGNPHDRNKNIAPVLEALRLLAQRRPHWRWHLVTVSGQRVAPPALPADAGYTAALLCGLTPAELREQYRQSDVLVNVSLYEGFGLPSIEAMACGTPVVQGDNQGLHGIARDGENCLRVSSTDPAMIARAIESICADADLRGRLIAGGRQTAAQFTLLSQFDAFRTEFETLLGQRFDPQAVAAIRAGLSTESEASHPASPAVIEPAVGRPMFSILVPTYNHAKFLPTALDSIIAQTFGDWEAVVVNDGSTDDTAAILDVYAARDPRIRPIHKENGGTVSALNEALKHSRGRWICWLSSDDFFEPEKLAVHVAEMRNDPQIRFFFTNFYLLDDPPGRKYPAPLDIPNYIPAEAHQVIRLFYYNYLNGISVAIDRRLFEELGGFNPRYRAGHDFDMWLRISARYRSRFIDRRLSTTRQHPGQDTRKSVMTGIIDSGVACLDFLNQHSFGDLYPALDLGHRDNAVNAIQTTLGAVFNGSSYMRICGFSVPLLDRMAEWLSHYPDRPFVDSVRELLQANVVKPGIEPEVGTALTSLVKRLGERFDYRAYDPVELLQARQAQLQAQGDAAMAEIFAQYLEQFSQRRDAAAPRVPPVAGAAGPGPGLRSNLVYWQQIQDKGYFETHPCYQGLNDSPDLGADEVLIQKYIPLDKAMRVVVIGCGYGRETLRIAPHVAQVYGIDVNQTILDKAVNFLAERGVRNFTPVPAERWKEIVPQGIDLVYSIVVFQHLTKDLVRDYVFGLADKLAPGGRFLVQFADAFQGQADAELKEYEPSVRWSREEIEELVRQAGLELISLESSQVTDSCIWHWACFGRPATAAEAPTPALARAANDTRRVLFVLHNFVPRNYGGVENYTYRLAKSLAAEGHAVTVAYAINSDTPCEPRVELSAFDGIRVLALHCHNPRSPVDQISHAQTEWLFGKLLQEGHYDVVHFQHFIGLSFSLLRLAREAGAKVCATLHDFYAICPRIHLFIPERGIVCSGPETAEKCVRCALADGYERFEPKLRRQLIDATQARLEQARSLLLDHADLISVPSAFVAERYQRYGYPKERLVVEPLGIEPVLARPRPEQGAGITFGFAGNIHDVKNYALLIEAFKHVVGEARLRLSGGGKQADIERLQALIADDPRIRYTGYYRPSELSEVFAHFDVLVLPSMIESYGLVVREALSAGIPVIAARAGALPEAIEDMRNGLLFEPGDAPALTACMQRLLDQPALLATLRQGISPPLTIETDARQWAARYGQLLGAAAPKRRWRIVVYSNERPEWACPQIRLIKPFEQLADTFELVWGVRGEGEQGVADESLAEQADLVVLQRFFPVSAHAELVRRLQAAGKPVVLEIDDLITALPSDNPHHAYAESVKPALLHALLQADAVLCSTEVLKAHLSEYARQVLVVPNAVDVELFHAPVPAPGPMTTLGILGSQTHAADFALLDPVLEKLLARYGDRLRLVFMGSVPVRWQGHPAVTVHEFEADYAAYAGKLKRLGLDIALVPLADNAFNRAKSNIKWLEYSACGIAGVYADLEPYRACVRQGETGLLAAGDEAAWLEAIADLVDNPERRIAIASAAQREVEARYSQAALAPRYAEAYRQLLGHAMETTMSAEQAATSKPCAQTMPNANELYQLWQVSHAPQDRDALWIAERLDSLSQRPVFHLVVIALPGMEDGLAANIQSLAQQYYRHWRLSVIAQIERPDVLDGVDAIAWLKLEDEALLPAANRLLIETEADWVGMFEAGDKLAPHALFTLVDKIERHPEWSALYTDEDSLDDEGNCTTPFFKTDFNLDLLRSAPFAVGGLYLLKRALFERLGGYRPELEGVETYDLVLRSFEAVGAQGIGHVADVLYHRFVGGGHSRLEHEVMLAARQRALEEHLSRCGLQAELWEGLLPGTYQIRYRHAAQPLVSIIIPTKNQMAFLQRCLDTLTEKTSYLNYEILIVDNGSDEADAVAFLAQLRQADPSRLRVLDYPGAFNFSAMNNLAAGEARGEYLLLLNNDTAVLHAEWLEEMLGHAQRPEVGIVGARLLFPNGTLQHAGVILGIGHSPAELIFINRESEDPGYFGRTLLPQNLSAVTGACLLIRKSLYHEVGGLDEQAFQVSYNDIDLCLKVGQKGLLVVWTPFATLMHEGSASQMTGVEKASDETKLARFRSEQNAMYDKWRRQIAFDPAYNRNLSLANRDCTIELSPALTWDPEWRPRPRLLAHPADRMGCGEYRIIAPMRALNEAGRIMGWETGSYLTPPELFRFEPDSLILQRQVEWSQIELMEQYMRHSKAFRVFEIDDLITNVPLKSARKKVFVAQKDLHKRFRKGVGLCHRLVVSTGFLAEEYKGYTDEVVIVPNYLERSRWGHLSTPSRRAGRRPRVGWAGSITHDGDLAEIIEVVKATAQEVDWVFFGMCPQEMQPYVKEFHKPVPLDDYPAKLASLNLDLAVAPLEDVPFNHAKSHLRLLEYGVMGYPVICTDITPYRGDYPVTRVRNRYKDWVDAIRSHVADMDELARMGDRLRDYVEAHWMLEDNLDVWLKAWLP